MILLDRGLIGLSNHEKIMCKYLIVFWKFAVEVGFTFFRDTLYIVRTIASAFIDHSCMVPHRCLSISVGHSSHTIAIESQYKYQCKICQWNDTALNHRGCVWMGRGRAAGSQKARIRIFASSPIFFWMEACNYYLVSFTFCYVLFLNLKKLNVCLYNYCIMFFGRSNIWIYNINTP